jgi:hypothetical protein
VALYELAKDAAGDAWVAALPPMIRIRHRPTAVIQPIPRRSAVVSNPTERAKPTVAKAIPSRTWPTQRAVLAFMAG